MLIVLVILKALHVWFYASLTGTSWVDTIIAFFTSEETEAREGSQGSTLLSQGLLAAS